MTSHDEGRGVGRSLRAIARKVRASLARSSGDSLSSRVRHLTRSALAVATAPLFLRGCDHVGPFARTFSAPRIDNRGRIDIGDHFAVNCAFVPVELRTGKEGSISVGDDVGINFGTVVAAEGPIAIGDHVAIGPYCLLGDAANDNSRASREPIEIGEGAWLAARVTVRPGARIGAHAVVSAGSVVSGEVPPFAVVSGSPARVLRVAHPAETSRS